MLDLICLGCSLAFLGLFAWVVVDVVFAIFLNRPDDEDWE